MTHAVQPDGEWWIARLRARERPLEALDAIALSAIERIHFVWRVAGVLLRGRSREGPEARATKKLDAFAIENERRIAVAPLARRERAGLSNVGPGRDIGRAAEGQGAAEGEGCGIGRAGEGLRNEVALLGALAASFAKGLDSDESRAFSKIFSSKANSLLLSVVDGCLDFHGLGFGHYTRTILRVPFTGVVSKLSRIDALSERSLPELDGSLVEERRLVVAVPRLLEEGTCSPNLGIARGVLRGGRRGRENERENPGTAHPSILTRIGDDGHPRHLLEREGYRTLPFTPPSFEPISVRKSGWHRPRK